MVVQEWAAVIAVSGGLLTARFDDGTEVQLKEDELEPLPGDDGVLRVLTTNPSHETLDRAQQMQHKRQRLYALAKEEVDLIRATGSPRDVAAAEYKLEMLRQGLRLPGSATSEVAHNMILLEDTGWRSECMRQTNQAVTWWCLLGAAAFMLLIVVLWSSSQLYFWYEPHQGKWMPTRCNLTSTGTTTCSAILSFADKLASGAPDVACCRFLVSYIASHNFRAGLLVQNTTLEQPMSLSMSRYDPSPCRPAEGMGQGCWYHIGNGKAHVETAEYFQATSYAYPPHGELVIFMLLPMLRCQTWMCCFMTVLSCVSVLLIVWACVWVMVDPAATLIQETSAHNDSEDEDDSDDEGEVDAQLEVCHGWDGCSGSGDDLADSDIAGMPAVSVRMRGGDWGL